MMVELTNKEKEGYLDELKVLTASNDDPESAHINADQIILNILWRLGYHDITNEYEKIKKWYA
jgi:hypothetical protein